MMDNLYLENVDEKFKFFFANHTRLRHPAHCADKDCTGIYNIILDDISGRFDAEGKHRQYFGHN